MRPWSYSRLNTYETCPAQYNYYYREHIKGFRPESPAANRGTDIHDRAEKYLLNQIPMYPHELQKVSAHAMMLKARHAKPEEKLGVRDDWTPCEYDDPKAYFRVIIDILYTDGQICHIQDWKTGQIYDSHEGQLLDYIPIVAAHYPDMDYHTRLVYIDQGFLTKPKITTTKDLKPIRLMLDGRIKNAEDDTIFPTKAGAHCKWCDYSNRYGGPCRF